jgi:DNA-binding NtrC family response regulator
MNWEMLRVNSMKTFKILIVDDDDNIAFAVQQRLETEGYEVRRANGVEEGYLTSLSFRPDLIITDIMMDGENGLELMKRIRKNNPNVRTIYMSGDLSRYQPDLEKEKKTHRASFLEKPFAGSDLMRLVYEHERGCGRRAA